MARDPIADEKSESPLRRDPSTPLSRDQFPTRRAHHDEGEQRKRPDRGGGKREQKDQEQDHRG